MRNRVLFTSAWVAAMLAIAHAPAAANPDPADALFNHGVDEMEAGRFETACPSIEESYRLDPRAGTLFALAECENQRGRVASALLRYKQYLTMYQRFPPAKQAQQKDRAATSRVQSAALARRVPMLTLRLPGDAPPGTVVWRDGKQLASAAVGVASAVDPGEHIIGLELPGGTAIERRVTLEKGQRLDVVLEMPSASLPNPRRPAPVPLPPETGAGARRIGLTMSGGAGVAGIVLGATTGVLAIHSKNIVDAHCDDAGGNRMECDSTGVSAGGRLKGLGTVSTVGFVVGSAGLVTVAVLFFTEPRTTAAKPSAHHHSSIPVTADLTTVGTGSGFVLRGAF
jgi:hypothetical protein